MPAARPPAPGTAAYARWLGVDWGEKRVGLALADELGLLATPAGTIERRAGKRPPVAELLRRAETLEARGVAFGLPLDDDGAETPRCAEVRAVAATVAERSGLPVAFVDERYTTARALRTIREQGGAVRGRKGDVDALAAAMVLEQLLRGAGAS